jgi:hypothetical protein
VCDAAQTGPQNHPYQLTIDRVCAPSSKGWTWTYSVGTGQYFGVDPILTDESWIACQVIVDGQLWRSDKAFAGDRA